MQQRHEIKCSLISKNFWATNCGKFNNKMVSLVHLDLCFPLQQRDSLQVNMNIIYSLIKEIACPLGHLTDTQYQLVVHDK